MQTYMELAQTGKQHEDFKKISEIENVPLTELMEDVAKGQTVIVPGLKGGRPLAIGRVVRSKVLCNFGTSSASADIDVEIEKVKTAIKKGASFVCDQSVGDNVRENRKKFMEHTEVPFATIPLYQNAEEARSRAGNPLDFSEQEALEVFEQQIEDGVMLPGIHAMNQEVSMNVSKSKRLMPIVSRGSGIMNAWMNKHGSENPYFSHFDKIIKISRKHNIPITFISSVRAGTVVDGFDGCHVHEWKMLRSYIEEAHRNGVPAIVDGLGHITINQIPEAVSTFKEICKGVPLGSLGPAVTDRGLGHEHIVNAIGTAVAVWSGVNYCNACCRTEHLGLPELEDIYEGIATSVIATHTGDLARVETRDRMMKMERKISKARKRNLWGIMLDCAVDQEEGQRIFERVGKQNASGEGCSICGDLCPFVVTGQVDSQTDGDNYYVNDNRTTTRADG